MQIQLKKETARLKNVDKLTDVKARYHCKCMANFYTVTMHESPGRPISKDTTDFVNYCINFIKDNAQECQFSLNEIKKTFSGNIPDIKIIIKKLNDHFHDDLLSVATQGDTIFIFKNSASNKLSPLWYEKRETDIAGERHIILEDIRSQVYDK